MSICLKINLKSVLRSISGISTYLGSSTLRKLSFLLGEEGFDYGKMVGSMFDFISKKFLIEAWCHRRELLNNAPDPT